MTHSWEPGDGRAETDRSGEQQYPIPPQASEQPASDDADRDDVSPGVGITSGAPSPGRFFPAAEPPAPEQPAQYSPETFANWEPPPQVNWQPEPAKSRGGRRRRGRNDAASPQQFAPPEQHPYAAQPPAQQQYAPPQSYPTPQPYPGQEQQRYGASEQQYAPEQHAAPDQYPPPAQHAEPERHSSPEQYSAPEPQAEHRQDYPAPQEYAAPEQESQTQPEHDAAAQPPLGWVAKSSQQQPPQAPAAAPRPAPQHPAPQQQHQQSQQQQSQQQPSQQQQPPARMPRPEDLLAPNVRPTDVEPASWGWRGRVTRGSGGLIKPKASAQELAVRSAIDRIQYGFSRPMTVVVVQPKGGAGKTPTTICLASAFGAYRGGYVVGWDDNETRGTLAVRVTNTGNQTSTVWDLLGDLDAFERFDARVGDLGYYVRAQPDAHFDALVSDDHPGNMSQIGEDEFHRLHTVLGRFYRMIVVDTGNNVRSPNWQAAVNAADLVVVVSSYQRDVGYSGSWVLDHLAQTGREELARNAVTVLTAADPTTDKTVRSQLLEHFTSRTRAVAEIPYDSAIAHGGPIRWTELAEPTRNAWTLAAATVVDALAEADRNTRR